MKLYCKRTVFSKKCVEYIDTDPDIVIFKRGKYYKEESITDGLFEYYSDREVYLSDEYGTIIFLNEKMRHKYFMSPQQLREDRIKQILENIK